MAEDENVLWQNGERNHFFKGRIASAKVYALKRKIKGGRGVNETVYLRWCVMVVISVQYERQVAEMEFVYRFE